MTAPFVTIMLKCYNRSLSTKCPLYVARRLKSTKKLRLLQEEYFSKINPEDFSVLTTTTKKQRITGKETDKTVSAWDLVCKWPRNYVEKTVLMDTGVAARVAEAIRTTTQAGPETVFVDADGGFLRVPQHLFADAARTAAVEQDRSNINGLSEKPFKKWKVFSRNDILDAAVRRASETYLSTHPFSGIQSQNSNTLDKQKMSSNSTF